MSEKFIPEHIDPFRYAEQSLGLKGSVNVADMHRLNTYVHSNHDVAHADLHFGVDQQKINFVKGHLKVKLTLQCQRCMEPFIYEIMSDFVLGVVKTLDEANALPEQYVPAMAKENSLALRELIEDEIILNLPIIPKHEPEDCKVKSPTDHSGWEQVKGKNPFHVLETLKQKKESGES